MSPDVSIFLHCCMFPTHLHIYSVFSVQGHVYLLFAQCAACSSLFHTVKRERFYRLGFIYFYLFYLSFLLVLTACVFHSRCLNRERRVRLRSDIRCVAFTCSLVVNAESSLLSLYSWMQDSGVKVLRLRGSSAYVGYGSTKVESLSSFMCTQCNEIFLHVYHVYWLACCL